jgi:predicted protein tyrosine phosphatase
MVAASDFYPAKQIRPYTLWIGSKADSMNMKAAQRHHIGLVVNCTRDLPFSVPGVKRVRVPIDDMPDENPTFLKALPRAVRAIDLALSQGQGVLVHCYAGISRSASVVAAFLMARDGLTPAQAMARIRKAKPETFRPRANFLPSLLAWEGTLKTARTARPGKPVKPLVPKMPKTRQPETTKMAGSRPR